MKIIVPALIVSVGVLALLYRALCYWAQNDMRKAMYEEGQVSRNTPVTHLEHANFPPSSLQDNDN